ncbi:hypothetical protein FQA39_LY16491 [Lamprigera yunnana]|nr:hypothetical protein FQA39_LY16491 [Lamprigera yunnana]
MQRKYPESVIETQKSRENGRPISEQILSQLPNGNLRKGGGGGVHDISYPGAYCGTDSGSYTHTRQVRSANDYEFRGPCIPRQSTPVQSSNLPPRHDTFGSQINYPLSSLPKDIDLSNSVDTTFLLAAHSRRKNQMDKDSKSDFPRPSATKVSVSPVGLDETKYLLRQQSLQHTDLLESPSRSPKRESLLEWFDRTVENELQKRRNASLNVGENLVNLDSPSYYVENKKKLKYNNPLLVEASTSGIDLQARLRDTQDTELLDAVDKLAKAEAMCTFQGAVRAAEEAAASAPPEFAEEAAAVGAQSFEAELTGVVRQRIDGVKPVEVLGYVGITRPNKPKKSG